MSDHELLEMAAKAAGIEPAWGLRLTPAGQVGACGETIYRRDQCIKVAGRNWDPLTDDGDALRLAVDLRLEIELTESTVLVEFETMPSATQLELLGSEPHAATRRAITRAAAEIGRTES